MFTASLSERDPSADPQAVEPAVSDARRPSVPDLAATPDQTLDRTLAQLSALREAYHPQLAPMQVGTVRSVTSGIVTVSGLSGVGYEELIRFPGNLYGLALNIDLNIDSNIDLNSNEDMVACALLGDRDELGAGMEARRTKRVADVPVGDELLGRVINATARPLDDREPVRAYRRMPIECDAPQIMERAPVNIPLQTGIKVIDALVPIGRGQRELILGDRQTGKTSIALDAIINQTGTGMICVYCAIGQRSASVAGVIAGLRAAGAMEHTVVVVAEGNDAPGLRYITPYAATTIAEEFMRRGRDVLIVYDDLTHHARAYREMSLLLRRPPGREAFPGDIFYIHSRLLERATHLRAEQGGGSLTALPIVETEAQNMSAYVPTNLISITDGQIYLSPGLFQKGVLPAVDVGKSVSRVGGKAQLAAYRAVAGSLKLAYAQYEELETFSRFGTRLDEQTRQNLEHGRRIRACLMQPQSAPVSVPEQIVVLLALTAGLFDTVPVARMAEAEKAVRKAAVEMPEALRSRILARTDLSGGDRDALLAVARDALAEIGGGGRAEGHS